ncbi:cytochrome P450 [Bdellovibrio svalbardensis]|uniref:Cytochrome P450 n=1 Tax=Bdellovibrio svalbardensis TaxID=2972972 RepID=A0ABT6DET2_9BACT|nr:cytochrome P450 [Bdellovibrio svalbardensis]MDG0814790.1 cytochrome P450 [Bdellovibrio svalbardensis]
MFRVCSKSVLLASCALMLSCTSSQNSSQSQYGQNQYVRQFASTQEPITFANPKTGKTFWEEFEEQNIKPALLKPRLSTFAKWVRANPIATFQDVRKNSPVLSLESLPIKNSPYEFGKTYVLSRYKDVVEALNQPTKFTVRNYSKRMEGSVGPYMLAYDGTQYNIKEKPWMREMMPMSDLPKVREIVRRLVNEAIANGQYIGQDPGGATFGRLEVVNQVARRVPIQLTGEYFGFPGPSEEKMFEWSRATQNDFFHNVKNETEVAEAATRAGKEMHAYLKSLIEQKSKRIAAGANDDDILSRLIRSKTTDFVAPRNAEDDRVRANIIGTLVGGVETTQAAIVQSMAQLFMRPVEFERARDAALRNDVDTVAKYVWEALRFHPVNPFVVRYAEQDVTLSSGVKIPKGSHLMIATQSAMFDDSEPGFENPNEFNINRNQNKFFHLGYGHHRCLGDYVSMVQVPEIVMALLKLPNVRPASGQAGLVDFRKRTKANALKADDNSVSFPESYSIEYDVHASDRKSVEVASKKYSYEDYLMQFDRGEYRRCLAGINPASGLLKPIAVTAAIFRNSEKHKFNAVSQDNKELLYCRLNKEYRSCIASEQNKVKFHVLEANEAHQKAFETCSSKANLTDTETAYYRAVMLGQGLDESKISDRQSQRNSGPKYAFEDYLKFYDRYTYRECFMNPAGLSAFQDPEMIMYARLNLDFRLCMGKPVLLNRYTGGLLGQDRESTYEKCKDGVYNEATFKKEGALSRTEKYFYETEVLGRKLNYQDVK